MENPLKENPASIFTRKSNFCSKRNCTSNEIVLLDFLPEFALEEPHFIKINKCQFVLILTTNLKKMVTKPCSPKCPKKKHQSHVLVEKILNSC